jgi:ribosomal protein S27AE
MVGWHEENVSSRRGDGSDDRPSSKGRGFPSDGFVRAPRDSLLEAFLDLTVRHATRLQQMGEVMALALDPCPRCMGRVIASDSRAACTECGWSYVVDGV